MSRPARTWFQSEGDKQKSKGQSTVCTDGASQLICVHAVASKEAALKPAPATKQRHERLNHKQRRRKDALAENKADKGRESRASGAIRGAKKAARPGKLTQFADPSSSKPKSSNQAGKGKKKAGSSFRRDMNSNANKSGGGGGGKKTQSSIQSKGKAGGKVKGKR